MRQQQHGGGPMVADFKPTDPEDIIHGQLQSVLNSRENGRGAAQATRGLLILIDPLKDEKWYEDIEDRPKFEDPDDKFWYLIACVIRLLERHHLWTKKRREVKEGEELREALG